MKNDILKTVIKNLKKKIKLAIMHKKCKAIRIGGTADGTFFNSITETGLHLFKQYAQR
jgi:hypothetical protein